MTTVDAAWLEPMLQAQHADTPALTGWSVQGWEGGVRVALSVDGRALHLDLHARRDGPAYATTPSLTIYLRHDGAPLGGAEPVLRSLIARMASADAGDLDVPKGQAVPEGEAAVPVSEPGRERSDTPEDGLMAWVRASDGLPERLGVAAAWALAAQRCGEPYPFPRTLGRATTADDALVAWVLERFPAGFDRDAFVDRWGLDAGVQLGHILAPLQALGVAVLDDAGVRFHAGMDGDVAIHAVFLWSEAVQARAAAVWGHVPDPQARAALDAIQRAATTGGQ